MTRTLCLLTCSLSLAFSVPARADTPSASRPADQSTTLHYQVVQIEGKVTVGPESDESLKGPGWFTPKVGDLLGAGLQIRVPMRSTIKLTAIPQDPPTVIMIERMSNISISELCFQNGAAKSRIKLAYGAIRAGVAESGTRSDMEIEAPNATLSKRGTDIFRFEYNDGRFMMSLSEQGRGMLQAIQFQAGGYAGSRLSRNVTAGQFVTHAMMRAIDNVQFDRNINVNDQFGLIGSDKLFTILNNHGLGFTLPSGNQAVNALAPSETPAPANAEETDQAVMTNWITPLGRRAPFNSAGDFGVGQGNLPTLDAFSRQRIGFSRQSSPLAQQTIRTMQDGKK